MDIPIEIYEKILEYIELDLKLECHIVISYEINDEGDSIDEWITENFSTFEEMYEYVEEHLENIIDDLKSGIESAKLKEHPRDSNIETEILWTDFIIKNENKILFEGNLEELKNYLTHRVVL